MGKKLKLATFISKQGDEDKVVLFLEKLEKRLKREIEVYERNIKNADYNMESDLNSYKERLEDAREAVEEKYLDVDLDQLGTNASRNTFMDKYLEGIVEKKGKVLELEDEIKSLKEKYDKEKEMANEEIKARKEILKKITEKV